MKTLTKKPPTQLSLVTTLLTCMAVSQANAQSTSTEIERAILLEEINRDFNEAAENLARRLSDPAFRMFLWHEIQASRDIEKRLDFKDMLTEAQVHANLAVSPQALLEESQAVGAAEEKMRAAMVPEPFVGVDLYFPVDSHRQEWRGGEELLVAFAPVQDESEVTSIIAYSVETGEQLILNPNEAPNVPTLVIAARGPLIGQPSMPSESLSGSPQQEDIDLFIGQSNDFIPVPGNYIYDPNRGALHDYCTASPDSWFKADFRGPCARHDMCLERRDNEFGCNNRLLGDLRQNCRHAYAWWNPLRGRSYEVALIYWGVVTACTIAGGC